MARVKLKGFWMCWSGMPHKMADGISSVNCLACHQDVVFATRIQLVLHPRSPDKLNHFLLHVVLWACGVRVRFFKGTACRKRCTTEPHLPFLGDSAESGECSIGFRAVAQPLSDHIKSQHPFIQRPACNTICTALLEAQSTLYSTTAAHFYFTSVASAFDLPSQPNASPFLLCVTSLSE